MAHEILGNRAIFRDKHAWHNKGRVEGMDSKMRASEWIEEVGGDAQFIRVPLTIPIPGDTTITVKGTDCIVRKPIPEDPSYMFVDTVSSYTMAQYTDYGEAMNKISDELPVESCALLRKGRKMFIAFRGQDYDVLGKEQVKEYAVALLSQEPGKANYVMKTDVRVVCENTLHFADERASAQITIPHVKNVIKYTEFAARLMGRLAKARDLTRSIYELWATTPMTEPQFEDILSQVWSEPPKPKALTLAERIVENAGTDKARQVQRKLANEALDTLRLEEQWAKQVQSTFQKRDLARTCFHKFNDDPQTNQVGRGTWWAGYNAVTEAINWRTGRGDVAGSILAGTRSQELSKTWGIVKELSGVTN